MQDSRFRHARAWSASISCSGWPTTSRARSDARRLAKKWGCENTGFGVLSVSGVIGFERPQVSGCVPVRIEKLLEFNKGVDFVVGSDVPKIWFSVPIQPN